MPDTKLKRSSDWRCRREEYLRASGRREDLICEGYESPGQVAKLVVIPGGGRRSPDEGLRTGLFIVKRGVSLTRIYGHTRIVRETGKAAASDEFRS